MDSVKCTTFHYNYLIDVKPNMFVSIKIWTYKIGGDAKKDKIKNFQNLKNKNILVW